MPRCSLVQMKEGQRARVVEFASGGSQEAKLMRMGLYKGKEVLKLSHFAMKGPVTVRVGRTTIALGHGMAGKVIVEAKDE